MSPWHTPCPQNLKRKENAMKILLIAPASGRWKKIGESRIFNGKTFRFSLLSLLSVAAETPPDVEIRIPAALQRDRPAYHYPGRKF